MRLWFVTRKIFRKARSGRHGAACSGMPTREVFDVFKQRLEQRGFRPLEFAVPKKSTQIWLYADDLGFRCPAQAQLKQPKQYVLRSGFYRWFKTAWPK